MSRHRTTHASSEPARAPSPELQQVLCDLQSPDDWTRASAVRSLCPCRRKDWGEPVYRYVVAMQDDPSPIVRGAVRHDLTENRRWNENWEARLIQERRSRKIKVTLAAKAMALADLCELLRLETGLPLAAGGSVADEKVTLFCRLASLRDVMRQLTRALDYSWMWQTKDGTDHFELIRAPHPSAPVKLELHPSRLRDRVLRSRASLALSSAGSQQCADEIGTGGAPRVRVTSADLLEALHKAAGLPIIADYTTRLTTVETAAITDRPLGELIPHIAETMRLRWQFLDGGSREAGGWLQFRSVWGHFEQLQEVPNRLLARWAEDRRQRGYLSLESLMEIAALPYPQRTSEEMTEGARAIWGLAEWPLAAGLLSEHLRVLANLPPEQRERATSGEGLLLQEMPPEQRQRVLTLALGNEAGLPQELQPGATLRVKHQLPSHRVAASNQARLEFCYRRGAGHAAVSVTFAATERGDEPCRRTSG
jgi:hypothetical protein